MSLRVWRNYARKREGSIRSAALRSTEQWHAIFAEQTTTPQEAAARILGDLSCYMAMRKKDGWDMPRSEFFADVEQLARAIEAYAAAKVRAGG